MRIGISTAGDFLRHYPRDYRRYEEPIAASDTSCDDSCEAAYLVRLTAPARIVRRGHAEIVTAEIPDSEASLQIVWYHAPYIRRQLVLRQNIIMYGRVMHKGSRRVLQHPDIYDEDSYAALRCSLQPVYALTEGLTQNFFRKTMLYITEQIDLSQDFLSEDTKKAYGLPGMDFAVRQIHFPDDLQNYRLARRRLAFDEFFLFSLSLKLLSKNRGNESSDFRVPDSVSADEFIGRLPYKLTSAQMRVFRETESDLKSGRTMNRLIQGDVGSGKTIIAALALAETALAGYQGCLMAPTEVLARQHYEKLCSLFDGTSIRTALLTGAMSAAQKKTVYEGIISHEYDVIIGTQALFQDKAVYDRLALIVTDEQHRFGVRQREKLAAKSPGGYPHVLVMSATPIPRTLAIVLYSDLDISVIDEKPRGRLPIKNCVVDTSYRQAAYRLIAEQVRQGHKAYVICPLVSDSDGIDAENVQDYSLKLSGKLGSGVRVSCLHGKMKAEEKNAIMQSFAGDGTDVLVSTTVIEVGVDVPSATVMMIENSERFGLAQLHQLRGRVGRSDSQSYCIFMYGRAGANVSRRLEIMLQTNDGFRIAAEDMKLRGPGDIFGIRQSGEIGFRIADIYEDSRELLEAAEAASSLTSEDPELSAPEHCRLLKALSATALGGTIVL